MQLVNTANIEGTVEPLVYARTKEGTINYEAYKGLDAQITCNKLSVNVKIIDARRRFGHLDLLVSPVSGDGEVWVERKNIEIFNDPAFVITTDFTDITEPNTQTLEEFLNSPAIVLEQNQV